MAKKGFFLNYDKENDILNISFGPAKKAISFEQEPEVYLRVDPKTYKLVGLTVLGFKQSFLAHKQEVSITPAFIAKSLEKQKSQAFSF